MIYLIASSAFVSGWKNNEYETILKIGYCRDDSVKNRSSAYITENPTIEVLYTIPFGDLQDEANLHHHFKHLKKNYGREWFKSDKEIIEFFKTHTTKESLESLSPHYSERVAQRLSVEEKAKSDKIGRILNISIDSSLQGLDYVLAYDKLVESFGGNLNLDTVIERFSDIDLDSMIPSNEIQEYLEKFNSFGIYTEAMRYLCSLKKKIGESLYNELLTYISPDYSFPLRTLDPKQIKTCSFQKTRIDNKIDEIVSNYYLEDSIKDEIYSSFKIGERYSKAYIKDTIRNIYNKYNYRKTPKANDLEEFFSIKPVLFYNKGKRDAGFEIIEKL